MSMRTLQQAYAAAETYSPAEEQFNRRRRTLGLFLGPALLLLVLALPLPALTPQAHRLAAIMALVGVLWVSEALPIAVTALLAPVLAVVLQVAPARQAFASFADPIIFLFVGSFMLAEAMFVHGVDRRIAYSALSWRAVGASAPRILAVYGAVATGLSMWISNTAATAMMFPIGLAIVAHLAQTHHAPAADVRRFAMGLMLITSFGASVGGMGTPVGTPPNLIGIGFIEHTGGLHIGFLRWMALGLPLVVVLFAFLVLYFWLACARGIVLGDDSRTLIERERRALGPASPGERNVLIAFAVTLMLWLAPGGLAVLGLGDTALARGYTASMPEGVAAMIGALLLFLLPVSWRSRRFTLAWSEAVRIDWGIILLYGGGLAIGELAFTTGLAAAVGEGVSSYLPTHTPFTLVALFTGLGILLSEVTSNTASANMIVPIAIAVARAAGVDPVLPALGATLGSSMGFMMPISTAPNAIVYSSGHIPIGQMMKFGLALDVAGFLAIVTLVTAVGPLLF
jgi:sodium-dependent dicarboxylate transporter 2/3/5